MHGQLHRKQRKELARVSAERDCVRGTYESAFESGNTPFLIFSQGCAEDRVHLTTPTSTGARRIRANEKSVANNLSNNLLGITFGFIDSWSVFNAYDNSVAILWKTVAFIDDDR